jgi:hypothetical protein
MPDPTKKTLYAKGLRLDSVALTPTPSNVSAEIFLTRNKGASMAENSAEEVARAAKVVELERRVQEQEELLKRQGEELERRAVSEERASCADIARSVAPKLKAKDVDNGDLLYRVRRAAKLAGDDKLEVELLSLLRAGNAAVEAAGLTRSVGFGAGEGEAPELPHDVAGILAPYLKAAGGDVARAHKAATEDITTKAAKNPRDQAINRAYVVLRDFNPNARA